MVISKRDRVAIVISIISLCLIILCFLENDKLGIIASFLPMSYWGYRFVKNDISFLKIKED